MDQFYSQLKLGFETVAGPIKLYLQNDLLDQPFHFEMVKICII